MKTCKSKSYEEINVKLRKHLSSDIRNKQPIKSPKLSQLCIIGHPAEYKNTMT